MKKHTILKVIISIILSAGHMKSTCVLMGLIQSLKQLGIFIHTQITSLMFNVEGGVCLHILLVLSVSVSAFFQMFNM